jgi:hypothetical protein
MIYNVELTTGIWPRDSSNGCIAFRNSGRSYFGSFTNWAIQNRRVRWLDLLHYNNYQYRAYATGAGVTVQRWERWKYEGNPPASLDTPSFGVSTEVGIMRWVKFQDGSRDLLCHDRSKLFITHYTTWYTIVLGGGGTWVEDHAYTLAGTLETGERVNAQDAMVVVGSYLYYARKEGVYRMDLTTGTSVLFYGCVGSGATYEILPANKAVISVSYGLDGATPVLLVGMTYPDWIAGVNLGANVIYWRGRLDDSHTPYSMAVGV